MKNKTPVLFRQVIVTCFVLTSACNKPEAFDCVKTTGRIVRETRVAPEFSWLIVEDNLDIYLNNERGPTIMLEGGANLLSKVRWEKIGDTLRLYNANYCNWARSYEPPVRVTLGALQLVSIVHKGFGKIQSLERLKLSSMTLFLLEANGNVEMDVKADHLYFYTNCSPSAKFTGEVNQFGVWSREFGKVMAEGLVAQECNITNASANEIRVFPVKKLFARIEQSGNIVYFHEPATLEKVITGTGKLIRN
jgi:hypothetical protein